MSPVRCVHQPRGLSRRAVLGAGLAMGALRPRGVTAADARCGLVRLEIPGLPDSRPGALLDWMRDLADNTSVRVDLNARGLSPESDELFVEPLVIWSGARAFPALSDAAVQNLRLYLRRGGFIFIDDQSGLERSDFDDAVRRDLLRVLPGQRLEAVGRDHAIYRSFFLLRAVAGRVLVRPQWSCVRIGDHCPVVYSRNDLSGAIWRGPQGGGPLDVIPGGEIQRRESRKWAINLALYALTLDYKKDAVHVETLLERMRRDGGYLP